MDNPHASEKTTDFLKMLGNEVRRKIVAECSTDLTSHLKNILIIAKIEPVENLKNGHLKKSSIKFLR